MTLVALAFTGSLTANRATVLLQRSAKKKLGLVSVRPVSEAINVTNVKHSPSVLIQLSDVRTVIVTLKVYSAEICNVILITVRVLVVRISLDVLVTCAITVIIVSPRVTCVIVIEMERPLKFAIKLMSVVSVRKMSRAGVVNGVKRGRTICRRAIQRVVRNVSALERPRDASKRT